MSHKAEDLEIFCYRASQFLTCRKKRNWLGWLPIYCCAPGGRLSFFLEIWVMPLTAINLQCGYFGKLYLRIRSHGKLLETFERIKQWNWICNHPRFQWLGIPANPFVASFICCCGCAWRRRVSMCIRLVLDGSTSVARTILLYNVSCMLTNPLYSVLFRLFKGVFCSSVDHNGVPVFVRAFLGYSAFPRTNNFAEFRRTQVLADLP